VEGVWGGGGGGGNQLFVEEGVAGSGHQALAATDSEGRLLGGGSGRVTVVTAPPGDRDGRKATAVGSCFTVIGGDRPPGMLLDGEAAVEDTAAAAGDSRYKGDMVETARGEGVETPTVEGGGGGEW
jgi:hypothetical protein